MYLQEPIEKCFTMSIRKEIKRSLREQVKEDCLDNEETNIDDLMQALEEFD